MLGCRVTPSFSGTHSQAVLFPEGLSRVPRAPLSPRQQMKDIKEVRGNALVEEVGRGCGHLVHLSSVCLSVYLACRPSPLPYPSGSPSSIVAKSLPLGIDCQSPMMLKENWLSGQ